MTVNIVPVCLPKIVVAVVFVVVVVVVVVVLIEPSTAFIPESN